MNSEEVGMLVGLPFDLYLTSYLCWSVLHESWKYRTVTLLRSGLAKGWRVNLHYIIKITLYACCSREIMGCGSNIVSVCLIWAFSISGGQCSSFIYLPLKCLSRCICHTGRAHPPLHSHSLCDGINNTRFSIHQATYCSPYNQNHFLLTPVHVDMAEIHKFFECVTERAILGFISASFLIVFSSYSEKMADYISGLGWGPLFVLQTS